jgi:hypothetical protein
MTLRKEAKELEKPCKAIIDLMQQQPHLLTEFDRLDIEASITRLMTALLQTEDSQRRPHQD